MDRDDSWKAGLDQYLTSDGGWGEWDAWCEKVIECFDDDFDNWLNMLYGDNKTPMEAAVKIQRLRTLYKSK